MPVPVAAWRCTKPFLAVASGEYDVVLVGGVEKMTDLPTADVTNALASAADTLSKFQPALPSLASMPLWRRLIWINIMPILTP